MKQDFYYMNVPNDGWNRTESAGELFKKLKDGWKILSAVGTSDQAHYILTKSARKTKKEKK